MNRDEFIRDEIEEVVKYSPYKIDVEVKPTDKDDELEVTLTRHYPKPIKYIEIEMELK